jgi:hypothetical protein
MWYVLRLENRLVLLSGWGCARSILVRGILHYFPISSPILRQLAVAAERLVDAARRYPLKGKQRHSNDREFDAVSCLFKHGSLG